MPLKTWNSTLPLGLDMLAKALKYARAMQILRFFVDVVDENGTTFEQELLGARGIDTVDPANIEAVLSTNFDGLFSLRRDEPWNPVIMKLTMKPWNISRLRAWSACTTFPTSVG